MHKTLIGGFAIAMTDSYNDSDQRIEDEKKKVRSSASFLWATSNNLKITTYIGYRAETYATHVFYQVELTDIQHTEFILRFQ